MLHVKKGDTVVVLAGKEKGRSGKIMSVNLKKSRVFVEKINMIKRHSRPSKTAPQGGIIEKEGPLHASNVNLLCPKCNKAVRARSRMLEDGKKVRVCAKCSEILDQ
ncbi:MAG: 50S ribosomal protein L24 [Deltaproteobacteria bacterium]|nr:50S ribosomal protein L24 [Deltaproteobacteria bacterium]